MFFWFLFVLQKQAECPPIQMEPVDLSVNSRGGGHLLLTDTSSRRRSSRSPESRKRRSSPANGIIDLRVNKSGRKLSLLSIIIIFFLKGTHTHTHTRCFWNYEFFFSALLAIVSALVKTASDKREEKTKQTSQNEKLENINDFSTNKIW